MRILYLTSPHEDYLADSLLHGFKSLFGADVVDFPKCEILYRNCPPETITQVRGRGFTLYSGLLDDVPVDRFRIIERLRGGAFDLVVFSSIWRQFGWFVHFRPWLDPRRTVVIDGEDASAVYPAAGMWWRRPYYWFLPRAHREFLYFKREWTPDSRFSFLAQKLPRFVRGSLPPAGNLRTISFGFPAEKIVKSPPEKTKDFPVHIVDEEVAAQMAGSHASHAFTSEGEYYADLRASRFGITTKRAGWDCLRHYEIAANGAVPCFRDLDRKPRMCAPHGLDDTNSICYSSAAELFSIISGIGAVEYERLQRGAMQWISGQTSESRARHVLTELERVR